MIVCVEFQILSNALYSELGAGRGVGVSAIRFHRCRIESDSRCRI
jgi:hypothetical protein